MAEKWTVSPFLDEPGELDQTYKITATDGTQLGFIYDIDDARLCAASPMLHNALREAYSYIIEVSRQFGIVPESNVTERIVAAIAAAEGE